MKLCFANYVCLSYKVNMTTSENAEELEVAVELQGKHKLIDPPASLRSAVWKYFGFPEVDGKVDKSIKICFASVNSFVQNRNNK